MFAVEASVTQAASHQVVNISELVQLICNFLGEKHCGRLMRTSRQFYHSTMVVVWREVDLISLLLLIPGTSLEVDNDSSTYDEDWDEPSVQLRFSPRTDWTRFSTYAPFVRCLRATSLYECGELPGYPTNALLPNLQHMSSTIPGFQFLQCIGLIPKIISPSLLSFRLVPTDAEWLPWLDQQASFDLMHDISLSCPRFQELAIFPEVRVEGVQAGLGPFYDYVSNMPYLRSLTCCGWMLGQEYALQRLGQLPLLEELVFAMDHSPEYLPSYLRSFAVSEESFPALRRLKIKNLDPPIISYLCTLEPLVRGLSKLCVVYSYSYKGPSDDYVNEVDRSMNVISSLAQTSPQLTDLKLHTSDDGDGAVHISASVLEVFKALHLLRLDLGFVRFEPQIRWEQFADALPRLQELHLGQQRLALRKLSLFARALPNLRLIVLYYLMPAPPVLSHPMADQKPSKHIQHLTIRAGLSLKYWSDEMTDDVARYLHGLWPNCIWEPYTESSLLENLNRAISDLRSQHKR